MTNYVKSTNFTSKDSLPSGNALKIIKGTEFDVEFNSIATAISTKADVIAPTFTGTVTGTFAGNLTGNVTGNADTVTTVSTAQALSAISGATSEDVGTYIMARFNNGFTIPYIINVGDVVSGSLLRPASIIDNGGSLSVTARFTPLSGTWKAMTYSYMDVSNMIAVGLWLRVT